MSLQTNKAERQLYKHPWHLKAVIRGKRGWLYVDNFVGWVRKDRNRRRADWYLEKVFNNLLTSYAQSEVIRYHTSTIGLQVACTCWDRTNCRCWERYLLSNIIYYFHDQLGGIKYPIVKLLRAWVMSEYLIQDYADENLQVIEKLERWGLNEIEREDEERGTEARSRELEKGMDLG